MRNRLLICVFCLLASLSLRAQAIDLAAYYAPAEGLADSCLKSALSAIIADTASIRIHYGTGGYVYDKTTHRYTDEYLPGTWDMFRITDVHGDGTIWDMYSTTRRYFPIDNGSACGMAIEHSFPKSWWGGDDNNAYKDLHHLCPSDYSANSSGKSNYPPGVVDSLQKWTNGFFRQGYMKGHPSHRVFEPADVYKGDFARAYFYIVTCYENFTWKEQDANCPLSNTSYLEFEPWLIDVLLSWHRADPVSDKELHRHAAVASIQHNRNPYIDYPELVELIWGNRQGEVLSLASLTCTADSEAYLPSPDYTDLRWLAPQYPSASMCSLSWTPSADMLHLAVLQSFAAPSADTLIALPAVTESIIRSADHVSYSGRLNTTGAGNRATIMGVSGEDGTISLSGITCPAHTQLRFRASLSYTAASAELLIIAHAAGVPIDTVADLSLLADEIDYTVSIPAGTDSISIASLGGSTRKRAAMQQIFLLTNAAPATADTLYSADIQPYQSSITFQLPVVSLDSLYASLTPLHGVSLPMLSLYPSPVIETSFESLDAPVNWAELGDAAVNVYSPAGVLLFVGPASAVRTTLPAHTICLIHVPSLRQTLKAVL